MPFPFSVIGRFMECGKFPNSITKVTWLKGITCLTQFSRNVLDDLAELAASGDMCDRTCQKGGNPEISSFYSMIQLFPQKGSFWWVCVCELGCGCSENNILLVHIMFQYVSTGCI